jgi:transposase
MFDVLNFTLKNKDMKELKQNEMMVGIDVGKAHIDICVLLNETMTSCQIKNQPKAITSFFKKLMKANTGLKLNVCMENTGYYNWPSYQAFEILDLNLFVVNALHLKKSIGLVRGKSDTIDAQRIAKYLSINISTLKANIIPKKSIRVLQALVAQRKRLVDSKTKLNVPTKELVFIADKTISKQIEKVSLKVVKEIEKSIIEVETQIANLIQTDSEIKEVFNYATSVQGVGKVLAWCMIVKTNAFKSINNPRKLACYAGVVPFEYQSGTSVYRRPKVSNMADKTLKKLLHLSAMRAIQLKGDIQDYYQRKVAEGKNRMSVLNAVRNKIVARICSAVNNKKMYQNYLQLS